MKPETRWFLLRLPPELPPLGFLLRETLPWALARNLASEQVQ